MNPKIYKRGPNWWVSYWAGGVLTRQSLAEYNGGVKVTSKREAEELRDAIIREHATTGAHAHGFPTLHEVLAEYAEDGQVNNPAAGAVWRAKSAATLTALLPDKPIDQLTAEDIETFKRRRLSEGNRDDKHGRRGRSISNKTVNNDLIALRAAVNLWRSNNPGRLADLPFRVRSLPVHRRAVRPPTPEEIARLRSWSVEHGFWGMVNTIDLATWLCLRPGSLRSFCWENVDLTPGSEQAIIRRMKSHNDEELTVPILAPAVALIREMKERHPGRIPLYEKSHKIKQFCDRAGVNPMTVTSFRHFCIWRMKMAGFPEAATMAITGHSESRMVRQIYGKIGAEDIRALGNRLTQKGHNSN